MYDVEDQDVLIRPTALLVSEADVLGFAITENLLGNLIRVCILTKDKTAWNKKLERFINSNFIEIHTSEETLPKYFNYQIISDYFLDKTFTEVENLIKRFETLNTKTLLILPYARESKDELLVNRLKEVTPNSIDIFLKVFLGDIIGFELNTANRSFLDRLIDESIKGKRVYVPKGPISVYPLSAHDASKELIRSLLSCGPLNREVSIIGREAELSRIIALVKNLVPGAMFDHDPNLYLRKVESIDSVIIVKGSLRNLINEKVNAVSQKEEPKEVEAPNNLEDSTYDLKNLKLPPPPTVLKQIRYSEPPRSLLGIFPPPPPPANQNTTKKKVNKKVNRRKFLWVFALLFLALISPFILFMINFFLTGYVFYKSYRGNMFWAKESLSITRALSRVSIKELEFYNKTPVIGGIAFRPLEISTLLDRTIGIGSEIAAVSEKLYLISANLKKDSFYDFSSSSEAIVLSLDNIYKESGFLLNDIDSQSGRLRNIFRKTFRVDEFILWRAKLPPFKSIVGQLPLIIGQNKPQTYLILFQNNMELRPTGGFIGSYALITLNGGHVSAMNVQDVYAADGQLKGHVEPPLPIKDYLGEAAWYLRDANWDPDFPTSANRIEWFLDKELDQSVDGVIAIDLEVVKSILKELGPVKLADFQTEVTSENLYEKTEAEVETDFFPGSYKKTNFLTALSRELTNKLVNLPQRDFFSLSKVIYENLESRHIQIFLHNKEAQNAFSNLGYDGGILFPTCGIQNCYADLLGIVEANLGVNKVNYFVKRSANFTVAIDKGLIKRNLTITYENGANQTMGVTGKYKNYLRIIVPQSATNVNVVINNKGEKVNGSPEITQIHGRKEIGFLVEISPREVKSVTLNWEEKASLDFKHKGNYQLYWLKQAGTFADPVSIRLSFPANSVINSFAPFALTSDGAYGYNTTLAKDLKFNLTW